METRCPVVYSTVLEGVVISLVEKSSKNNHALENNHVNKNSHLIEKHPIHWLVCGGNSAHQAQLDVLHAGITVTVGGIASLHWVITHLWCLFAIIAIWLILSPVWDLRGMYGASLEHWPLTCLFDVLSPRACLLLTTLASDLMWFFHAPGFDRWTVRTLSVSEYIDDVGLNLGLLPVPTSSLSSPSGCSFSHWELIGLWWWWICSTWGTRTDCISPGWQLAELVMYKLLLLAGHHLSFWYLPVGYIVCS